MADINSETSLRCIGVVYNVAHIKWEATLLKVQGLLMLPISKLLKVTGI